MKRIRVFVAGHRGMVGSAIARRLAQQRRYEVVTRSRGELDLTRQEAVEAFFNANPVDWVVAAAGRVGGICANDEFPADFIYENLAIECNLIQGAHRAGVQRLLFLGSSCIYPRNAPQPIPEEALLNGTLETTNEPYAIAKIAGIKLCESYNRQHGRDYRSVMPTNLYGPGDNFDLESSHVVPALMRRFHEAKIARSLKMTVWGTGSALREFMHVDDLASACVHILELPKEKFQSHTQPRLSHVNVGVGKDCSIRELAETMSRVVAYKGRIEFDTSKPDGTPRKLLDISRMSKLGWRPSIRLVDGLQATYEWFLANETTVRGGPGSQTGQPKLSIARRDGRQGSAEPPPASLPLAVRLLGSSNLFR